MTNLTPEQYDQERDKLEEAVDKFSGEMRERLIEVLEEKEWVGWDDPQFIETIVAKLNQNCGDALYRIKKLKQLNDQTKKDLIDTANLAMFLAHFCDMGVNIK